jgi:hypothetical protein
MPRDYVCSIATPRRSPVDGILHQAATRRNMPAGEFVPKTSVYLAPSNKM